MCIEDTREETRGHQQCNRQQQLFEQNIASELDLNQSMTYVHGKLYKNWSKCRRRRAVEKVDIERSYTLYNRVWLPKISKWGLFGWPLKAWLSGMQFLFTIWFQWSSFSRQWSTWQLNASKSGTHSVADFTSECEVSDPPNNVVPPHRLLVGVGLGGGVLGEGGLRHYI